MDNQIISNLTVTVTGITHTYPDDIDMLLVGPAGQSVMLMSDTGGNPDVSGLVLTFDDAAAASLPDSTVLSSGTFKPTNVNMSDVFPAPATIPASSMTLSAFNGTDPNGNWTLYVVDQLSQDIGSISGGWQLDFSTVSHGTLGFAFASSSVGENGATATVTVERTGGSFGAVTVDYATSDGTATAGADYTATAGTLLFADGELSQTFTVPIADDAADEPDETVLLMLSAPGGGATLGASATSTLKITDDDLPPIGVLAFASSSFDIGENGATATVTVERTGGSFGTLAIDYATSDGTATAGADYTATAGTLVFADGELSQTFTVPIADDAADEPDETVLLTLSAPGRGAALRASATSTLTITDDDLPLYGTLQFIVTSISVGEGSGTATVMVERTGGSFGAVTVDYATSDGTATAGADYTATAGTLLFADGELSQTFTVPIADDAADEPDETVLLMLSAPGGGASLGSNTAATLTISDSDLPPVYTSYLPLYIR